MARPKKLPKWQPWKQYFELVRTRREKSWFGHGGMRTAPRQTEREI
jgi:hypothetical protein